MRLACAGLFATTLLASCADPEKEHLARQSDTTLTNPAGRFQMMELGPTSTGGHRVLVLDTRFSRVTECRVEADGMSCSLPKEALP